MSESGTIIRGEQITAPDFLEYREGKRCDECEKVGRYTFKTLDIGDEFKTGPSQVQFLCFGCITLLPYIGRPSSETRAFCTTLLQFEMWLTKREEQNVRVKTVDLISNNYLIRKEAELRQVYSRKVLNNE